MTRPELEGAAVVVGFTVRITGIFSLAWLFDGRLERFVELAVGPDAHCRVDGDGILFFRPTPSGVSDDHHADADPAQDPRAGRDH